MANPRHDEYEQLQSVTPAPKPLHVLAGIDLSSTDDNDYQTYPGYAELVADLVALLRAGDHLEAFSRQASWYKSFGILVIDGRHPIDDAYDLAGDIPPWPLDLSMFKFPEGYVQPESNENDLSQYEPDP